jgi:polysaccharide export outer membrane protein
MTQDYLIGAEDIIEVMVWKNPDLSRVVNVRPDGRISLPLIGDVQAAGLTAIQLRDSISESLKNYYKQTPEVSVIVNQVNSYAIYVLGEVRTPGKYVVKSGTTFLQAVTLAGGFTDFASKSNILLRRRGIGDAQETAIGIAYKDVLVGKQSNILLKPGDTIIIP